jgi:hypothetical protein
MHEYRISSPEKLFLLIENLQVCIGVYAYSKNFGFAAYLNPVVIRGDGFQCDKNKNILYCNRFDDLYNSIIYSRVEAPIYIGISIGLNSGLETYQQVNMLNKNIDNLIVKLNCMGIVATKLNLRNNHIFILDTLNQKLITPLIENSKKLFKTK